MLKMWLIGRLEGWLTANNGHPGEESAVESALLSTHIWYRALYNIIHHM